MTPEIRKQLEEMAKQRFPWSDNRDSYMLGAQAAWDLAKRTDLQPSAEGWTGRKCAVCSGTGDTDDRPGGCNSCGGTGEEYGKIEPSANVEKAARERYGNQGQYDEYIAFLAGDAHGYARAKAEIQLLELKLKKADEWEKELLLLSKLHCDEKVAVAVRTERERCAAIAKDPYKIGDRIAIDELPGVVGKIIAEAILNPEPKEVE